MSEPTLSIPFAIGEAVWFADAGFHEVSEICPDCAGTKFVTLKLGNGDEETLGCALCGVGCNPPTGYVKRTIFSIAPKQITLMRVHGFDGDAVEYATAPVGVSCYHIYTSSLMFRDKADCEAKCAELVADRQKQENERAIYSRASKRRDLAHSVSYWRGQAARHRADMEDALRRLDAAKKKSLAQNPVAS